MAKPQELLRVPVAFDYDLVSIDLADALRSAVQQARKHDKKSLKDVIDMGNRFLAAKAALGYGRFGRWRKCEVRWSDSTVKSYKRVALWLGSKSPIIGDLKISPTVAFKLSARWVPDEARQEALDRAEAGEKITIAIADEIIVSVCKRLGIKIKPPSEARLIGSLEKFLTKCRHQWNSKMFRIRVGASVNHVDSEASAKKNGKEET